MDEQRMPPYYDRRLSDLTDMPEVLKTRQTPIRHIPTLAVGGSTSYTVQTFRQPERGETIFLEVVSDGVAQRLVLPPEVTKVIQRQHDSLTTQARKRGAARATATREELGIVPGFLKKKA